ncbi:DUF5326 family protein [Streptomyces polyrhachis]|uniref:DUF5326 family protein n=1 Tax=Streptomyces polyrhachis TaxID=1282885 RepID=A0ABW2G8L6_9ACTN
MSVQEITRGLPWWAKWVVIPLLAVIVFGGLLLSVLSFLFALVFKVLLFAVLVAGLVFLVRRFGGAGSKG